MEMRENNINKEYSKKNDLYDRCLKFAVDVRALVRQLPKTSSNIEDGKQVIRASGSVGANYIEAWDAISDKDELHRLKICRKEAKESRHWLVLVYIPSDCICLEKERERLCQEAFELTRIFGSIVYRKEHGSKTSENQQPEC